MTRDDGRFVENAELSFAMYADENGLTREESLDLAERLGDGVRWIAEDRPAAVGEDTE